MCYLHISCVSSAPHTYSREYFTKTFAGCNLKRNLIYFLIFAPFDCLTFSLFASTVITNTRLTQLIVVDDVHIILALKKKEKLFNNNNKKKGLQIMTYIHPPFCFNKRNRNCQNWLMRRCTVSTKYFISSS